MRSALDLWSLALNQPLGLYLRTPDPHRLKNHLYAARAKAPLHLKPQFDRIQLRTSPMRPTEELWLVNPPPEDDTI